MPCNCGDLNCLGPMSDADYLRQLDERNKDVTAEDVRVAETVADERERGS